MALKLCIKVDKHGIQNYHARVDDLDRDFETFERIVTLFFLALFAKKKYDTVAFVENTFIPFKTKQKKKKTPLPSPLEQRQKQTRTQIDTHHIYIYIIHKTT